MKHTEEKKTTQEKVYKTYQLTETPFTIYEDEHGKHLLLGNYKIAEQTFQENGDIYEYLKDNQFNVILSMIIIATETYNKNLTKQN